MKTYFKVVLEEMEKESYICVDDISSVENDSDTGLSVQLKDGKTHHVKSMSYVSESATDIERLIRLETTGNRNKVPIEITENVKKQEGMVSIRVIRKYLSNRTFNSLWGHGYHEFYGILAAIEDNRLIKWRGIGKKTLQEIIDLFLQMDLIERKDDQIYKPFEGYISKISLYEL